jgi:hypothetical protein
LLSDDDLNLPFGGLGKNSHLPIAMSRGQTPDRLQLWIDARKRHRLSHEQVQMARELGLNPRKLGKLDNHRQEPWKLPLPAFIEQLYRKRFRKAPMWCFPSKTARACTNRRKRSGVPFEGCHVTLVQAAAEAGSWRKTMRRLSGKATEA